MVFFKFIENGFSEEFIVWNFGGMGFLLSFLKFVMGNVICSEFGEWVGDSDYCIIRFVLVIRI